MVGYMQLYSGNMFEIYESVALGLVNILPIHHFSHLCNCLVVDILWCFGGGEFVLDSDFLEGLGAEFWTFGAVAVGAEAEVGADDFLFSVG